MISKFIKSIFSSNKKDKDMATKVNKPSVANKATVVTEKLKAKTPAKKASATSKNTVIKTTVKKEANKKVDKP
ncbi:MAG TPA: hypothetical protein PKA15_01400, partial [Chitinophagales bacterium]|nr:hypothetical protein [Chitinophagales bacterium]HNC63079.1 hypothetical protein [Chitinophagales bacterium]